MHMPGVDGPQMVHGMRSKEFHLNFLVKVGCKQNLDCIGKEGTLTASDYFTRSPMYVVEGDYLLTHPSV